MNLLVSRSYVSSCSPGFLCATDKKGGKKDRKDAKADNDKMTKGGSGPKDKDKGKDKDKDKDKGDDKKDKGDDKKDKEPKDDEKGRRELEVEAERTPTKSRVRGSLV